MLARFNQVFLTKLLPVSLNLESTSSRSQDGKADAQILLISGSYRPKADTYQVINFGASAKEIALMVKRQLLA